ncbi:hypothetical protein Hanom_Chr17g01531061 [Helianthus anomalus]
MCHVMYFHSFVILLVSSDAFVTCVVVDTIYVDVTRFGSTQLGSTRLGSAQARRHDIPPLCALEFDTRSTKRHEPFPPTHHHDIIMTSS